MTLIDESPAPPIAVLDAGAAPGDGAVPTPRPPLTWKTVTAASSWRQGRAELELRRAGGAVETARVEGRASVRVAWPFAPLAPRERAQVRVRVTGADGIRGPWSAPMPVFAAFLGEDEWIARPIGLAAPATRARPALLRRTIDVDRPVATATLYATAVGVYQASVNGVDVDDQVMKPGWTHAERPVHESTDVTALLRPGRNVVGIRAGGAWGTEVFAWPEGDPPDAQPWVAAQLRIDYVDGTSETVVTDERWRAAPAPTVASGLYAGEEYDARLVPRDAHGRTWHDARFDDETWDAAALGAELARPIARSAPAVRRIETLPVRAVDHRPGGAIVLDFGQNLVGRLRIRVRGPRGSVVTLRHAEVLEGGELAVRPLRSAAATDRYTLSGGGDGGDGDGAGADGRGAESWEPEFTFHGFRFAEVTGWPGAFDPADVVAVVVHSDLERTGWFRSSHPLLDRFHENVVWGLRGNFLALPTDCPQRDERLGWTGDIQVFAPAACFLYDVRAFLSSWLDDLALDQRDAGGAVPWTVPNVFFPVQPAAAWGDAVTVVPTVLHERYDDPETLRRALPGMRAWTDTVAALSTPEGLWSGGFQFGDWLDPDAPPHDAAAAKTHPDIVATAYRIRSLDLLARAEREIGAGDTAARAIEAEARAARLGFARAYIGAGARMSSDAPTAYALAIAFDLLAGDERTGMLGEHLARLVRAADHCIGTGFVGTPLVLNALADTGHLDDAARALLQDACPSWLYPVTMGATTVWERWDSLLPDGSVNPGGMTSFNHYALGAVVDWLHRSVAGLAPAAPGYARLRIAPRPIAGLDHAEARLETPYGRAEVAWRRHDGRVEVRAIVPPNAEADVRLPGEAPMHVGSGSYVWMCA